MSGIYIKRPGSEKMSVLSVMLHLWLQLSLAGHFLPVAPRSVRALCHTFRTFFLTWPKASLFRDDEHMFKNGPILIIFYALISLVNPKICKGEIFAVNLFTFQITTESFCERFVNFFVNLIFLL